MNEPSAAPAAPPAPVASTKPPATPPDASRRDPVFTRFPTRPGPAASPLDPPPSAPDAVPLAGDLALIAPHVAHSFYLAGLADDPDAVRDPVGHYHRIGWTQGRSPNPDFDTRYYLRSNEDVRAAGVDPLLHYLRFGRAEGRLPQRAGGPRRAQVEAAIPPSARRPGRQAPLAAAALGADGLAASVRQACLGKRGLVVSLSHDRYIDTTGGMQIFIADEQAQFNGDRVAYLHLAPIITRLVLAQEGDEPLPLQLTLDGVVIGIAFSHEIVAAVAMLADTEIKHRLLVVHSLFGHRCSDVTRLSHALRPLRNFFWLHDYGSLCAGYNLLRNDVVFCAAPAETSMACRICVYGDGRAQYRAAIAALFSAVAFDVMAPSEAPARIWRAGAGSLSWRSLRVHPNALLRLKATRPARPGPIRIAFIGHPIPAKGWTLFVDLYRRARGRADLAFFHFANREALRPMPGLTGVPVRVDRHDRLAMARAIAEADIDLVAMLAPWPETFSYVTREAIAAVADAVREHNRGVVLAAEADVARFFLEGEAAGYVERQRAAGREEATFLACGTTATFDPLSPVLDPARLMTADPAVVVIAGNQVLPGTTIDDSMRFDLPDSTNSVRLVSRHVVPARLDPDGGDLRALGIAITSLALDGAEIVIGDARRVAGWHGAVAADGVQWTNGDATLDVTGARQLTLTRAASLTYQRCKLIPET
jgi:hypothetical protein